MFQNKSIRWSVAAIVIILHFVALGYWMSWFKDIASNEIDPPQEQYDAEYTFQPVDDFDKEGTLAGKQMNMTIYVLDQDGMVTPVALNVEAEEGMAKKAVQYLVKDGPASEMLPKGFQAVLPKGTKVNGINIIQENKLAVVDLSKEFTNYDRNNERQMIEALTWTLTEFPSIEQIQLQVNGHWLYEMPLGGMPLDDPLTRHIGINLERWDGVRLSEALPVTLYFTKHTADDEAYLVPVTRMIKNTDSIAFSTIGELIRGPQSGTFLESTLSPSAEVLQVSQKDGEVIVNFAESAQDDLVPQAIQAVTLSLKENVGERKVQILVNGKKHE